MLALLLVRRVVLDRERRAKLAERERDLATREAVVEERARLARELHGTIAHHVSIMVVQAGGAPSAQRREPLDTGGARNDRTARARSTDGDAATARDAAQRGNSMTSVLIADDQPLVRVGLRKILASEPETSVVGEAADGEDAVSAARQLRPDVVLMDIRMPVLDGIEATRRIVRAAPATRVLILTTFGLDTYVYDALRAGASGFMLKDAPPEEITAAVRIVAGGDALLAPAVTRAVIEEFTRQPPAEIPAPPPALAELTPREREVLDLLARGLSNTEICERLVISEATAKTHVARILQKLGLRDRVQAVIYAYEAGIVAPGAPADNQPIPRP